MYNLKQQFAHAEAKWRDHGRKVNQAIRDKQPRQTILALLKKEKELAILRDKAFQAYAFK